MAISTPTSLVANASSTDASSYTIASATYTSGRVYVLAVAHAKTDPTAAPTITATNTFTQLRTLTSTNRRLTVFTCKATSTVTETVTIDFAGVTQLSCAWSMVEVASGFNSADPFGLDNGAEGTGTSGSVSAGTIPADSVCIGAVGHYDFEGVTPGDNELADVAADPVSVGVETQYAAAGDNTISASWTTSGEWDFIIVEIQTASVTGAVSFTETVGIATAGSVRIGSSSGLTETVGISTVAKRGRFASVASTTSLSSSVSGSTAKGANVSFGISFGVSIDVSLLLTPVDCATLTLTPATTDTATLQGA